MSKTTKLLGNSAKNPVQSSLKGTPEYWSGLRAKVKGSSGELLKNKHINQMEDAYNKGDVGKMSGVKYERELHNKTIQRAKQNGQDRAAARKPFRDTVDAEKEANGDLYVGLRDRLR